MTVYFDNAATTRVCEAAAEAMGRVLREQYGNPSSTHAFGREAAKLLEKARENVAKAAGAKPEEIFFTSGGTEADNWAILGGARQMQHRGKHVISFAAEHDAVLRPLEELRTLGYDVTLLKPDAAGRISLSELEDALREDTVLVSVMMVNNETGAVNPISEIARLLKKKHAQALLHTDAVQAFCKLPFSADALGADMVTLSSHKIHGPKGCGALYVRNGVKLKPLLLGGGQEKGYRSGTEAMPAIVGFGEAARIGGENVCETEKKLRKLRTFTMEIIRERIPGILFLGEGDAPHILSLSLPGYRSEVLLNFLDAKGICVSKSSACKRGGRSRVLEAMNLPSDVIDGAIRVSFSDENTEEEALYFADTLCEAAASLRTARR